MQKAVKARDDQREVNNLPKLSEPQAQGRMLVIDEASEKVARELLAMAKDLIAGQNLPNSDPYEKVFVELEDGWYSVFGSKTGFCYGQYNSKHQAQKEVDEMNEARGF